MKPAKPTTLVPAGQGKRIFDGKGNAGIQIRSQRIPNHHDMIGYVVEGCAGRTRRARTEAAVL